MGKDPDGTSALVSTCEAQGQRKRPHTASTQPLSLRFVTDESAPNLQVGAWYPIVDGTQDFEIDAADIHA